MISDFKIRKFITEYNYVFIITSYRNNGNFLFLVSDTRMLEIST